tara:strand:- start:95 stop:232 length:138 start_codon:yes stop_codon:yes gene_type:complete
VKEKFLKRDEIDFIRKINNKEREDAEQSEEFEIEPKPHKRVRIDK